MSTLILLRHGQASFGADNYDQLSAYGAAQAKACAEYWLARNTAFGKVLIGPRQRHGDTARLATEGLSVPPFEQTAALDEFAEASHLLAAAELRTGIKLTEGSALSKSELLRHYEAQIKLWAEDALEMDHIDSIVAFRRRVASWLDAITAPDNSGQRILAVTSGGVIAAVLSEILGLSNIILGSMMWNIENCSMTAVVWSAKGRSIRYFNQTAHLPPLLVSGI